MVINTARREAPSISERSPTFLIVDECHRAGSPENAKALQGSYIAALGLSATPEREYDEGFEEYIYPTLGPVIFTYGYVEAYNDGVIVPFKLTNVRVDLLSNEQQMYKAFSKRIAKAIHMLRKGQGTEETLKRLLQQRAAVSATAAMRIPVAGRLLENHRGSRCLVFHERVAAAELLAEVISRRGHRVTLYHSGITPLIRRDNLKLYRRGQFDVLVCCRALDEGINVPETSVAIIASSTASSRQRIQRLGRVLRPALGKEHSDVYTIYATEQEEHRLRSEAVLLQGITDVSWQQVRTESRNG
jgi:superfamily II DNA or RNA helicase